MQPGGSPLLPLHGLPWAVMVVLCWRHWRSQKNDLNSASSDFKAWHDCVIHLNIRLTGKFLLGQLWVHQEMEAGWGIKKRITPIQFNCDCMESLSLQNPCGAHGQWFNMDYEMSSVVKKAQYISFPQLAVEKNHLEVKLLTDFYCSMIECWRTTPRFCYATCTAADSKALEVVVRTAQTIIHCSLCPPCKTLQVPLSQ